MLIDMLTYDDEQIQAAGLRAISNLAAQPDELAQKLLDAGVLSYVNPLLNHNNVEIVEVIFFEFEYNYMRLGSSLYYFEHYIWNRRANSSRGQCWNSADVEAIERPGKFLDSNSSCASSL
jgi:hypothetical protein